MSKRGGVSFGRLLATLVVCAGLPRDAEGTLRRVEGGLTGEAFVVPRDESELMRRVAETTEVVNSYEWRLHDVNVVLVPSIE